MFPRSCAARRRLFRIAAAGLLAAAAAGSAGAAPVPAADARAADAVFYRIFLLDGSMLVSYGEFAQVADRVVLSVPIGGTDTNPVLHLLTISGEDVDWPRTNAYVHAARARRYADTRGEAEFARLTREVADTLNQVGLTNDPAKSLALAEAARRQLAEWPEHHYGYRAAEIAQLTTWLDQVVSELRAAAGFTSFDFSLSTRTPVAEPAVQLLPPPNLRERLEYGMVAARRAGDPAERVTLLRAVLDSLQAPVADGSWMATVRARASAELAVELRIDRAYTELSRRILDRAQGFERRADVRGLESLVEDVLEEDARLDRARPGNVGALLAALDARIDSARRLRLARDAWQVRSRIVRAYWREVRKGLDQLLGLREWLQDVRQLSGPTVRSLRRLGQHALAAERELSLIRPPAEVASAHRMLVTSSSLAARASSARLDAVRLGDIDIAWQASSAAAGSLMLLDEAVGELRRLTNAPRPGTPAR